MEKLVVEYGGFIWMKLDIWTKYISKYGIYMGLNHW